MKKIVATLSFLFLVVVSFAQEVAEAAADETRNSWSDQTKMTIVMVFAVFVIILVLRTFRNKPEV